ncbi:MAG: hypothetical protein ONB49_12255 [candidate division KSB1 bacterium]|nr:hypothetical protein [candidate division KSB1 bacterium]
MIARRRAARQPHGRALPQDSSQVMWSQPRVALRTEYLLASLVLPGSGHLLARHNKKGLVFSAASLAVLGGILHYARQTRVREREYLRATGEADYDRLYARYNAAYKRRNALMAGYGLLSVLALYDLHSRANRSVAVALAYEPSAPQLLLHLNKSW